jgi:hypothetical protein
MQNWNLRLKFLIDEKVSEQFCHGKSSSVLSYFHQIRELTPPTEMHLCLDRFWNRFPGPNNSGNIGIDGMRNLRRRREFDFRQTEFFSFATTTKAAFGPRQHQMQRGEQSFSKTNNLTTHMVWNSWNLNIHRPIPRTCSTLMLRHKIYINVLWMTPDILFINCKNL